MKIELVTNLEKQTTKLLEGIAYRINKSWKVKV